MRNTWVPQYEFPIRAANDSTLAANGWEAKK